MPPREALPEPTSVSDRDPPVQADGIDPSAMLATTPSTVVQEIVMPLSDPQELTFAEAVTTFFEVVPVPLAAALPGTASSVAVSIESESARRTEGPYGLVMTTYTPVTADAATLLDVKSGEAAPPESRVPVTWPSDVPLALVSVTL